MIRVIEQLEGLRQVVPAEDVRVVGAWSATSRRRYASAEQLGTGEGPFVETTDWRWDGVFECASPLAGLGMLAAGSSVYWVKSDPPPGRAEVSVLVHGWAGRAGRVMVTGRFHGAYFPAVPVAIEDEPPAACVLGGGLTKTGAPYVVARVGEVEFSVLPLPACALRVGRNRLWRLRESTASGLPPDVQRLLTRGRSGVLPREFAFDAGMFERPAGGPPQK